MRTLRLVRIAAEAEKLHLQARLSRTLRQAVIAAAAAAFGLFALAALHFIGYVALRESLAPLAAASVVFGVDAALAVLLYLLSRGGQSLAEREALDVRHHALSQLQESAALFGLVAPIGRAVGKRGLYGMTLAALTARFLNSR